MRRVILLAALLTTACIPVPWHRNVLTVPDGTIRVVDAATKAPISGATVIVRRYNIGPPPRQVTNSWSATTSSSGEASFAWSAQGEWVMPLMMHGVPQWGWEVCAAAPDRKSVVATWVVQREWSNPKGDAFAARHVEIALSPGTSQDCSSSLLMESYPDSVTGVDDRWKSEYAK